MPSLPELSWHQLTERLRALEHEPHSAVRHDIECLLHELQVHQVELEMQNRELREAQQRLEESRAQYAELYDRAPVGYVTLDPQGLVLQLNLTAAEMLGRTRDSVVGVPFIAAARLQSPADFFAHLRVAAARPQSAIADVATDSTHGAGCWQLTTRGCWSKDSRLLAYQTTMVDVTEVRRAEKQREALEDERRARAEADWANRMKDQFLGMVSHELRTPLNAVLGWTQILSQRGAEPALLERGLDIIRRNGESLRRLVDDLLDVSRSVHGKLRIEHERLDVAEVARAALEQVRWAARDRCIELRDALAEGCVVQGDRVRLQQVVCNLLSNAIKFSDDGGEVGVTLERHDARAVLTVCDKGCGIPPVELPHVFEYFHQVDSSSTRRHGGLGLGLAIAHDIVQAHGGELLARSEGPSRGTAFSVSLPLAA